MRILSIDRTVQMSSDREQVHEEEVEAEVVQEEKVPRKSRMGLGTGGYVAGGYGQKPTHRKSRMGFGAEGYKGTTFVIDPTKVRGLYYYN